MSERERKRVKERERDVEGLRLTCRVPNEGKRLETHELA